MATSTAQSNSLIFQAQYLVAEQLNSCPELSATPFWPEDKLDIEFQIHDALAKQGVACTVMTPQLQYQGKCGNSTAWDFANLELVVVEDPQINRARPNAMTALDIAYVAQEWLAGPESPTRAMFAPVSIRQGEDNKLVVVRVEMRALLHDERDNPQIRFPNAQSFIFDDGVVIPVSDNTVGGGWPVRTLMSMVGKGYVPSDTEAIAFYARTIVLDTMGLGQVMPYVKTIYVNSTTETMPANLFSSASNLESVVFKGRTLDDLETMTNYPWGIDDPDKFITI